MVKLKQVRKPEWLRVSAFSGADYNRVEGLLKRLKLNTVCQEANCPNRGECFNRGTATFLILGPYCTRDCHFCNVPAGKTAGVDLQEPQRVAQAVRELNLKHVVITSVTRDDLPDGGAEQFARTIDRVHSLVPGCTIEVLTPDFQGSTSAVDKVILRHPDVFNHNLETVPDLYTTVRPGANYQTSLKILRRAKERGNLVTKSGLMVGLGESHQQLIRSFDDLADNLVQVLTIGQYLSPSSNHLPVDRYVSPEEFEKLADLAREAGIETVVSGPLVRSSYRADMVLSPQ